MSALSPAMHDLAKRLLQASQCALCRGDGPCPHAAVAMFDTLRITLSKFTGAHGYVSLLNRALGLARFNVPALQRVQVGPNGQLHGMAEIDAADAAVALAAHLLTLLITFIGEPLTARLLHVGWPDANLFT